jgi:hypothetical protein
MSNQGPLTGIDSLKIKAKLLQKAKAKSGKPLQLKEALNILAVSAGYGSWRELKAAYETTDHYCPPGTSAHWKTWYKSYDEARTHLMGHTNTGENGRAEFLLPYRDQYFVCEIHYLEALGISASDSDLAKVGTNWVELRDAAAFARLNERIKSRK